MAAVVQSNCEVQLDVEENYCVPVEQDVVQNSTTPNENGVYSSVKNRQLHLC